MHPTVPLFLGVLRKLLKYIGNFFNFFQYCCICKNNNLENSQNGDKNMHAAKHSDNFAEDKYAHDEEVRFRAAVRRNRLLGLWAADLMGLAERERYAGEIVDLYFKMPDDEAAVRRIAGDLSAAGREVPLHDIRVKMTELLFEAVQDAEIP